MAHSRVGPESTSQAVGACSHVTAGEAELLYVWTYLLWCLWSTASSTRVFKSHSTLCSKSDTLHRTWKRSCQSTCEYQLAQPVWTLCLIGILPESNPRDKIYSPHYLPYLKFLCTTEYTFTFEILSRLPAKLLGLEVQPLSSDSPSDSMNFLNQCLVSKG